MPFSRDVRSVRARERIRLLASGYGMGANGALGMRRFEGTVSCASSFLRSLHGNLITCSKYNLLYSRKKIPPFLEVEEMIPL